QGTAATQLRWLTCQSLPQAQMTQHLFQGDLLAEEGKIDTWPWSSRRGSRRRLGRGHRHVDARRRGVYAGSSRGAHCPGGASFPLVAHGLVVGGGLSDRLG